MLEKYYSLNKKNKIDEIYKKASGKDVSQIKKFRILKNLKFVEFPKLGLDELITEHLKELKIDQFYKFQQESIEEIAFDYAFALKISKII